MESFVHGYANAQLPASNPFQIMWLCKRPDGDQYIGLWEQNYLAYAIDRANKQGFTGGLAHRDAIARFQLKLFTSDPDYPRAQGAPYIVGVGVPPYVPSWGNVIASGKNVIREAFWVSLFPGLALTVSGLSLNLLGDGLRDVLDPRLRVQ